MDLIFRLPFLFFLFIFLVCFVLSSVFYIIVLLREMTLENSELLLIVEHTSWNKLWTNHYNLQDSIEFSRNLWTQLQVYVGLGIIFLKKYLIFLHAYRKQLKQRIVQSEMKNSTVWQISHNFYCPRSGTRWNFSELVCLLKL